MTKQPFSALSPTPLQAAMDFFASSKNTSRFCDTTAWNTWLWGDYLNASVFSSEGVMVLRRESMDGVPTYTALCPCPLKEKALSALIKASEEKNEELCLFPLTEEEKDQLLAIYPDAIAEFSPDWRDYLYDITALATFKGKKYNGQRNHLNRFRALYPNGKCMPLEGSNRQDALEFLEKFYGEGELSPAVAAERKNLTALVSSHPFLGQDSLYGFVVHDGEQVVALAIAEAVGDTLYVHAEKALRQCQGAYQAIVSGVASAFCDQGILYLNREEDDGNQGLRTSKLSYHPMSLLSKWRVTLRTGK